MQEQLQYNLRANISSIGTKRHQLNWQFKECKQHIIAPS
jgi:hypothetical protein